MLARLEVPLIAAFARSELAASIGSEGMWRALAQSPLTAAVAVHVAVDGIRREIMGDSRTRMSMLDDVQRAFGNPVDVGRRGAIIPRFYLGTAAIWAGDSDTARILSESMDAPEIRVRSVRGSHRSWRGASRSRKESSRQPKSICDQRSTTR